MLARSDIDPATIFRGQTGPPLLLTIDNDDGIGEWTLRFRLYPFYQCGVEGAEIFSIQTDDDDPAITILDGDAGTVLINLTGEQLDIDPGPYMYVVDRVDEGLQRVAWGLLPLEP